jgi:WD40 repeat protein
LAVWDVTDGVHKVKSTLSSPNLYSSKWNPHLDGNQFALISASSVTGMDLRSMKEAWKIPKAHKFQVRDIDFNPNKQYYVATCGDDCSARFWDFRNPNEPLKELMCHTHWVWRVRFNTFHDQLVLTSGSDSRVLLHSLPSISSEPQGRTIFSDSEEEDRAAPPPLEEGILAKYEEHEDAVYAVEWSSYDPWIFASLSYDGRLVINRVPKSQKYKILL